MKIDDILTMELQINWFCLPQSQPSLDKRYGANIVAEESIETTHWPTRYQNSNIRIIVFWHVTQRIQPFLFGTRSITNK